MRRHAFSLVEMLVAITLLSMLIGLAVFSFRQQLMTISKIKTSGINTVIKYNQLSSSIESIKYYVVDNYDNLNRPMNDLHYFFKGSSQSLSFITTNPLFSKNISVVLLTCSNKQLLYTEEELYRFINFLKPIVLENSKNLIMFKNIKQCNFSYILNNKKTSTLINDIPNTIELSIQLKNKKKFTLFTSIKSDDNLTIFRMQEATDDE